MKDEIHSRCVQYQGIVDATVGIVLEVLTHASLISEAQVKELKGLMKLGEMKLTMNTEQLQKLMSKLESLNVLDKLSVYKDQQLRIQELLSEFVGLNRDIQATSWLVKKVKEDPTLGENKYLTPRTSNSKHPKKAKKAANEAEENELYQLLVQLQEFVDQLIEHKLIEPGESETIEVTGQRDTKAPAEDNKQEQSEAD